jgi:hypothetical protein
MLVIRAAWWLDDSYSPAEAVYGAQPVLPGQFLSQPEPPSPSFLQDLQDVLAGRQPRATAHHCLPAPPELPDQLLRATHVLVRRNAVQRPLSPLYDGPYLVLERSLHTFKLQMGDRMDTVSTSRLKTCMAPPPPRRMSPSPCHLAVAAHLSCVLRGLVAHAPSGGKSASASNQRLLFCCRHHPVPPATGGRPTATCRHSFIIVILFVLCVCCPALIFFFFVFSFDCYALKSWGRCSICAGSALCV